MRLRRAAAIAFRHRPELREGANTMDHIEFESSDAIAPASSRQQEERYFITALARGLDVLSCFRPGDRALSNLDIARRCGLPKSTVTRITFTLTRLGYLSPADNGAGYALGSATLALGSSVLARMDVRQLARPLMQELADFSSATVAIAVRDRLSMIYVEVCRSTATLALTLQVGSRISLASSAIGRAYLAAASDHERAEILARSAELDDDGRQALRLGIEKGIADQRQFGCATSFGEWQKEVNGIAIAFRPPGAPAMSINCGGPSTSLSPDYLLTEVRPRLIALARRIESINAG
jgi:DNA-binding IclR family transcriptional regulator